MEKILPFQSICASSLSNAYVLVEKQKHKRPTFYIRPQKQLISLTSRSVQAFDVFLVVDLTRVPIEDRKRPVV